MTRDCQIWQGAAEFGRVTRADRLHFQVAEVAKLAFPDGRAFIAEMNRRAPADAVVRKA